MSDSNRKSGGLGGAVDKLFHAVEILIAIFLGVMIFFTFLLKKYKIFHYIMFIKLFLYYL